MSAPRYSADSVRRGIPRIWCAARVRHYPEAAADVDVGIAAQTILPAATERGPGGCMFGNVNRDELAARGTHHVPKRREQELIQAVYS